MNIKYNNTLYNLEIDDKLNQISASINEDKLQFNYKKIANNIFNFFIDDKFLPVHTAEDEEHFYVNFDGNNFVFDKVIEEEKSFDGSPEEQSDKDVITPPMPGSSVVKILVEKNKKVSEGDSLIIVEAMKMETTLYSSIDGVVTEINVEEGEQVDSNKTLIIVEKE